MIVADTNLVAYLLLDGPRTAEAEAVWARDPVWLAPPFWRPEWRNVLAQHLRHDLIDLEEAARIEASALALVREATAPPADAVFEVVVQHGLSAYDAEFVATAAALEVPLVTADRRIVERCPDVAVSLKGFGGGG